MKKKKARLITVSFVLICTAVSVCMSAFLSDPATLTAKKDTASGEPIKWVEFDVPYEALKRAMDK